MWVSVRTLIGVHSLYFTVHLWFWLHAYDYYRVGLFRAVLASEHRICDSIEDSSTTQNTSKITTSITNIALKTSIGARMRRLDARTSLLPTGDTDSDSMRFLNRLSPGLTLSLGCMMASVNLAMNVWFLAIANVSEPLRKRSSLYHPWFEPDSLIRVYTLWRNLVISFCFELALKNVAVYHRTLFEMEQSLMNVRKGHFFWLKFDNQINNNINTMIIITVMMHLSDQCWHIILLMTLIVQLSFSILWPPLWCTIAMCIGYSMISILWMMCRWQGKIPADVWGLRCSLDRLILITMIVLLVGLPVYIFMDYSDISTESLLAAIDAIPASIGVFYWFIFPRFATEEDRILHHSLLSDRNDDEDLKKPMHQIKRWLSRSIMPSFFPMTRQSSHMKNGNRGSDGDGSESDIQTGLVMKNRSINNSNSNVASEMAPLSKDNNNEDTMNVDVMINMDDMMARKEGWFGFLFDLADNDQCELLIFIQDCQMLAQKVADEWLLPVSFMDSLSLFSSVNMPQKNKLERKRKFRQHLMKNASDNGGIEIPGFGAATMITMNENGLKNEENGEVMMIDTVMDIIEHWILEEDRVGVFEDGHLDRDGLMRGFEEAAHKQDDNDDDLERCLQLLDSVYKVVYYRLKSHFNDSYQKTQRYRILSRLLSVHQ